jgi:2-oxoglutarate dehydrogenase E2 component (dihydrolipoamide succinyltransferase)
MPVRIEMPQMGESVVEGTIERWLVAQGDRVEKDQTLCEVTTDKVDVEIPAPSAGVVTRLLVAEGETVEVGTDIAEMEPAQAGAVVPESAAEAETPAAKSDAPPAQVPPAGAEERKASPLARRLAEQHGVDLEQVPASGARLTKADLVQHLERAPAEESAPDAAARALAAAPRAARPGAPAAPVPGNVLDFLSRMKVPVYAPREGDEIVPFTAIRRRIAEHMVVSKIVSPHVGTVAEADLHNVTRFRDRVKDGFKRDYGFGLSFLPFIVQATVRALREYPQMNAAVVDEQVVQRRGIHIGVAVETERGLLVPVVRDADRLSLGGIAEAVQRLAERARSREITADELQGGTFTVTNPGREGNLYGFAVINQPQVGILRSGELKKRVVVVERDGEEALAIRPMMYLALSYDHRVIDGVTGNGFLYRVARNLEADDFEL